MAKQVPLSTSLPAIDRKSRSFYDNLPEDEQKGFSGYLMLRYASSIENNNPDLVAYYLRAANQFANKNMFDLSKHPKLQWLMITAVSPGMGTVRHSWLKQKKKEKSPKQEVKKKLMELYPAMKEDDIDLMSTLIDKRELTALLKDYGEQK